MGQPEGDTHPTEVFMDRRLCPTSGICFKITNLHVCMCLRLRDENTFANVDNCWCWMTGT